MSFDSIRGIRYSSNRKEFFVNVKYSLIIFFTLIAPAVSFDVYYSLIFIAFIPFLILSHKRFERNFTLIITALLLFIFTSAVLKSIIFGNLYDIKEFVKLFLFIYIFLSVKESNLNNFHVALFVFLIFDSMFSIFQFFHINFFFENFISSIFNSPSHYEFSSSLSSVRALGLSPGPGQHGIIGIFSLSFFLIRYSFSQSSRSSLVGVILSMIVIVLSQSKTAIISSVFVFISFSLILIFVKRKFSVVFYVVFFAVFSTSLIFTFWDFIISVFYDLKRLSESGLRVSSMDARIEIWKDQLNAWLNSGFFFTLFGSGRSYLEYSGVYHNSFDNDYVYLLVSYGFFGLLMFFAWFFFLTYKTLLFSKQTHPVQVLIFIVWSGLFTAFSLDFFSDVKIIALLSYLTRVCCNAKNN